MHVLEIQATLEGRGGEDDVETLARLLRELVREADAQRVLVVDVGIVDPVQHQVNRRDPQHGRVEVESVEHAAADVLTVIFEQITLNPSSALSCYK